MKPKYNLDSFNFEPTYKSTNISYLKEIECMGENYSDLDFNTDDGDTRLSRNINKDGETLVNMTHSLVNELTSELEAEFVEKFNLFIGLSRVNLIYEEFPFNSWELEFKNVSKESKSQINLDHYAILEGILEIHNNNKEEPGLGALNFAKYLNSGLNKNVRMASYYHVLTYVAKQFNPDIDMVKLLSFEDSVSTLKCLHSKSIKKENNEVSQSLIDAAVSLANLEEYEANTFENACSKAGKYQDNYGNIDLFKEKCIKFSNSKLWKTIKENEEALGKFISKLGNCPISAPYFFITNHLAHNINYSKINIKNIKEDYIQAFFDNVIKSDVDLGLKIIESIGRNIPTKLKDEFQIIKEKIEISLNYQSLNESTSVNSTNKTKKMKV